jgi:DNA-binding GntR family transcriptional regulator
VLLDALSYHEGWISEERLAGKLQLSGKQVRKMLGLLQKQGFVAREHRRERKVGDKVQSVAEYEDAAERARTASYVAVDYPLMFDMLRLRLHAAKARAAAHIDDGNVRSAAGACAEFALHAHACPSSCCSCVPVQRRTRVIYSRCDRHHAR